MLLTTKLFVAERSRPRAAPFNLVCDGLAAQDPDQTLGVVGLACIVGGTSEAWWRYKRIRPEFQIVRSDEQTTLYLSLPCPASNVSASAKQRVRLRPNDEAAN